MKTHNYVLYTHTFCKYCKLAKSLLQNFIDEGTITVHDVIEEGYPSFNPSTPSLYKFDINQNIVSRLDGLHSSSVYLRFLKDHG